MCLICVQPYKNPTCWKRGTLFAMSTALWVPVTSSGSAPLHGGSILKPTIGLHLLEARHAVRDEHGAVAAGDEQRVIAGRRNNKQLKP